MKKMVVIILFATFGKILSAQHLADTSDTRPLNSFNLSFLGDASLISIHYERLFVLKPGFFLAGKLGIGYNEEFGFCAFGPCGPPERFVTLPHHITANWGKRKHFLEFGLGGTIISGNTAENYLLYPIVGYRVQPLKSKKVNFRIFGSVPFTGLDTEDILFIPAGLSFGICF